MPHANIVNELKHFNGRTGLGAVMGSKRLRAIVVRGHDKVEAQRPDALQAVLSWFREHYDRNGDALHKFGTARGVPTLNADGILPTRNFHNTGPGRLRAVKVNPSSRCLSIPTGS